MIKLIKKLENPYTVDAMQKAQQELIEDGFIKNPIEITTTHYYVRFLPTTNQEYETLVYQIEIEDENELFDYPLDYEISDDGSYYLDPSIGSDSITWQYTAVPKDFTFPSIEYEILADLYLIEEGDKDESIYELIEDQSLYDTDNWDKDDPYTPGMVLKSTNASKWRPSGQILAIDHQLNQNVGVEGAKVVMRRWFKWSRTRTDVNGNFTSPKKFRKKVRYKIKWASSKYKIRSGHFMFSPAWTTGPKIKGAWNTTFTGNLRLFYATVHTGAWDFFFHDPFGLKKPSPWFNPPFYNRLKISALDKCKISNAIHAASIIHFSDIRVYRKTTWCNIRNTLGIYGLTLHELGHSNQRANGIAKFAFCSKLVRESWANSVEWAFVMHKYGQDIYDSNTTHDWVNLSTMNFNGFTTDTEYPYAQIRTAERGGPYTPLFIDLIDYSPRNSRYLEQNFNQTMVEDVEGYTLKQLEITLANKGWSLNAETNMDHIEDYLQDNYNNSSENNIEEYFDTYYRPHF